MIGAIRGSPGDSAESKRDDSSEEPVCNAYPNMLAIATRSPSRCELDIECASGRQLAISVLLTNRTPRHHL